MLHLLAFLEVIQNYLLPQFQTPSKVIKILAKKIRFIPKLKPERAFDVVRTNTSVYGMLYSVRAYFWN